MTSLADMPVTGRLAVLALLLRRAAGGAPVSIPPEDAGEYFAAVEGALATLASAAELADAASVAAALLDERGRGRPPLSEAYPALDRWRRAVLKHPERRPAIDVAAAWELTAMECERSGETESAELARQSARTAVLRRRAS